MFKLPHTVKRTVLLDAAPSEVWEAVTDEGLLSGWLADEVELEPREGGEVVCRYEDGEERRGEVELVEEAERLAFHWRRQGATPSRVEFLVDAVADGTRLTVIETRRRLTSAEAAAAGRTCAESGWAARLEALRLVLGRLVLA